MSDADVEELKQKALSESEDTMRTSAFDHIVLFVSSTALRPARNLSPVPACREKRLRSDIC